MLLDVSLVFAGKAALPEVVFVGRSNVGKSSLVNMLVNRKTLAPTSAVPGFTQVRKRRKEVLNLVLGRAVLSLVQRWHLCTVGPGTRGGEGRGLG